MKNKEEERKKKKRFLSFLCAFFLEFLGFEIGGFCIWFLGSSRASSHNLWLRGALFIRSKFCMVG